MASEIPEGDREAFRELLGEAMTWHMPFGKYGPEHYPPRGVPLRDLPPEYLGWFKQRGFPSGKLGQLMELVYEAKIHGADEIFRQARARSGGRTDLREKKKAIRRRHQFPGND